MRKPMEYERLDVKDGSTVVLTVYKDAASVQVVSPEGAISCAELDKNELRDLGRMIIRSLARSKREWKR